MNKFKFELGEKLECLVTGFRGIATARIEYINGCIQYCLVPKVGSDNKRPDGEYIDQKQLKKVGKGVTIANNYVEDGGPQRDCPIR